MDEQQIEARRERQDAFWNGPRFHALLGVTLVVAIAFIYFIASVKHGDFSWDPTAHDPGTEITPAGW
ncbi:MAG: hypothetical protein M3Y87_33450 [Myxococcota bacterium]|nr:hypothetical protein [Myxococcota bacterium]